MTGKPDSALRQATEEEILERLANGESLVRICEDKRMPSRMTVQRWQDADEAFDVAVMRAREAGMFVRAEMAVEAAKAAEDAAKGRLAFDAERWYVGKLSNAFSDDKTRKLDVAHSGAVVSVDASKLSDDALREIMAAKGDATNPR